METTEEYNGTSWSSVDDLTGIRANNAGFGSITEGITCGGRIVSASSTLATTEEYA